MKKVFLVLIAAAFVASGSGLLMAQSTSTGAKKKAPNSETEIIITSPNAPKGDAKGSKPDDKWKTRSSPPKNDVKSVPKPPSQPCIEKGCQLGTPQVVR
jgi:hypothetical protein